MKSLQGQDVKINLPTTNTGSQSRILKLSNIIDPVEIHRILEEL